MKFFVAAVAMAAVNGVKLSENPEFLQPTTMTLQPRTNNWSDDPLNEFDNKHYRDNTVSSLFPDHVPIPVTKTIGPHEFPTIH